MMWLVGGSVLVLGAYYLYSLYVQGEIRRLVRALRWVVGGLMLAIGAIFGLRGNWFVASFLGAGGLGVIARGRLGPIDFGSGMSSPNNTSSVRSRYFAMTLEHETGNVLGSVREGHFSGRDLAELGPDECWALYNEVEDDPDSVALYESWLDANREGWRAYFAEHFGMDTSAEEDEAPRGAQQGLSGEQEAYELLGLEPGASPDAIRAAHRKLMKKVHPDAGGSAFLAAKINQAKDMLLKKSKQV